MNKDVTDYIGLSLGQNVPREIVRQQLISAGWETKIVEESFSFWDSQNKKQRKFGKKHLLGLFVTLLLIILAVGGWFMTNKQPGFQLNTNSADVKDKNINVQVDLNKAFEQIFAENIAIEDTGMGSLNACGMEFNYLGYSVGGNAYAKQFSKKIAVSEMFCESQHLEELYLENYWIDGEIYGRQYENNNFEKVTNSDLLKAALPKDHIRQYVKDEGMLNFKQVEDLGGSVIGETNIESDEYKMVIKIIVYKLTNRLKQLDYSMEFTKETGNRKGSIRIIETPKEIKLPELAPNESDFLRRTMSEINSYEKAVYSVRSGKMIMGNSELSPLVFVTFFDPVKPTRTDCYLSLPGCSEKLEKMKQMFVSYSEMVANSEAIACDKEKFEEGNLSDIYKDQLELEVRNDGRNPRDSFDYSYKINFKLTGSQIGDYSIRLKAGKEYCYVGKIQLLEKSEYDKIEGNWDDLAAELRNN